MSIDYKQIVEELENEKVIQLLSILGADPQERKNFYTCRTICHNDKNEEASYKLYYYKDTHLFYCYTECGSMSIFNFLKHYYEAQGIDYDWYEDVFLRIVSCSSFRLREEARGYRSVSHKYNIEDKRVQLDEYNSNVLAAFQKKYLEEWLSEGITKDAMDKFNILYSDWRNKIIIPHYDINNRLVGIRGRALNEDEVQEYGKYMPVEIEGTWYSHPLSFNLYGLGTNVENIRKSQAVWIFEGEKSVLLCENLGVPNCAVATCGSNLNKFQINLLMREAAPREIIVCYDNEEKLKSSEYFDKLYKMCSKYKWICNMSFIYDRRGLTKPKDSPIDCGGEVFKKLLKERVTVT